MPGANVGFDEKRSDQSPILTSRHCTMRLIHTYELYIREFLEDPEELSYAALSHRWGREEVSFQTFSSAIKAPLPSKGASKILRCCEIASSRGMEWIWVDTACIDKTSSAELSEAINSMWRWYQLASECYAYLADFDRIATQEQQPDDPGWNAGTLSLKSYNRLSESEWFTRGWTLQELLAPNTVIFYDMNWCEFGTKRTLAYELSRITRIPSFYLRQSGVLQYASIAMKMSWASKRKTTRKEDVAYCLFGLFDINMPMLYGEGDKAFMRLQLEIIKKSPDESIFAWRREGATVAGMLASSPAAFSESSLVDCFIRLPHRRLLYGMTNQGLELRLLRSSDEACSDTDVHESRDKDVLGKSVSNSWLKDALETKRIYLNCGYVEVRLPGQGGGQAKKSHVRVTLVRFPSGWQRVRCDILDFVKEPPESEFQSLQTTYSTYYVFQYGI